VTVSISSGHHREVVGRDGRLFRLTVRFIITLISALLGIAMAASAVSVFWFHLAVHPILSGSMRPTFGPGWMIITKPIPVSQVRPGEILLFKPPGSSASFAHRVIQVEGSPNHPIIQTKGDANPVADPWRAQLKGTSAYQVVAEVPKVGWLFAGGARMWLRASLIGLVGVAVTVGGARSLLGGSAAPRHSARRRSGSRRDCPGGKLPAPAS
jgi:signal peptidase